MIYTDFSKAFDVINHDILLSKLVTYNFTSDFRQFMATYLCQRKQRIRFNGTVTKEYIVTSGVPQGSNLGPLLFLLFVNDLPKILKSHKLLFADDLKLFRNITSYTDTVALQEDMDKLYTWCETNKLLLNINKCNVMTITRKVNYVKFNYNVNGIAMNRTESVSDLGVTIKSNLTFTTHINEVINNATRNLGFVMRLGKEFSDPEVMKKTLRHICTI